MNDVEIAKMSVGKCFSKTTTDFVEKTIELKINFNNTEDDTIELIAVELNDVLLKFGFRQK